MRIDILTLFPEMFSALNESILGRAQKQGKVEINVVNIRDYTEDKHLKCDDYPFGGGAGMVMMPQPIGSAIEAVDPRHEARRIYLSPKGETAGAAESVFAAFLRKAGAVVRALRGGGSARDRPFYRRGNFYRRLCADGRRAARRWCFAIACAAMWTA